MLPRLPFVGSVTDNLPVLLIGAEGLPGKSSVKGGACAIASATRPWARP